MSDLHPATTRAQALHAELLAASRAWRSAGWRLGVLLRELADEGLHAVLGYASVREYAVGALGLEPRQVRDLTCLGRRLAELPKLSAALEDGSVGWTRAREIARVANPETEAAWLSWADGVNARELEAAVSGALHGELPPEHVAPALLPARRRMVFTVEEGDAQVLREALAEIRQRADLRADEFDEGAALAELARSWLETAPPLPDEPVPSTEPYRIVLVHCPKCRETAGIDHEVSEHVAGEARCDAEVIDLRPGPDQGRQSRTLSPRLRRQVLHRWGWKCLVPNCEHRRRLHVHHLRQWAHGGDHRPENLTCLCDQHHRLVHDGRLSLEVRPDGAIAVQRATGPVVIARPLRTGS